MLAAGPRILVAILVTAVVLAGHAPAARGQGVPCLSGGNHVPIDLGAPDANGVTREDSIATAGEKHGFYFTVTKESSGFVYVGDQWYDLDLFLYYAGACASGSWEELARAWSVRAERRSLQFVRPDEQIIPAMRPGQYLLVVGHKYAEDPQFARDFDPRKGFTIRVALNTVVCGLSPEDEMVPNPLNPAAMMPRRPDSALYQLAMTLDPPNPGPFSLISFNAIISPPYSDLFDFGWELDGSPVPNSNVQTIQLPASALPNVQGPRHTVRVTARGVRVYPDPDQPHVPLNGGTLTVECGFTLAT